MKRDDNAYNEVKALLGKLDRSIDDARKRRLDLPPKTKVVFATPIRPLRDKPPFEKLMEFLQQFEKGRLNQEQYNGLCQTSLEAGSLPQTPPARIRSAERVLEALGRISKEFKTEAYACMAPEKRSK